MNLPFYDTMDINNICLPDNSIIILILFDFKKRSILAYWVHYTARDIGNILFSVTSFRNRVDIHTISQWFGRCFVRTYTTNIQICLNKTAVIISVNAYLLIKSLRFCWDGTKVCPVFILREWSNAFGEQSTVAIICVYYSQSQNLNSLIRAFF